MRTIMKVEYEPVFVETIPEVLEERKVYITEKYKCSVHSCLCGCGEKTVLPLNPIVGGGWSLIKHEGGKVSFTPSVGNFQLPCKSHYIMTKNVANFV